MTTLDFALTSFAPTHAVNGAPSGRGVTVSARDTLHIVTVLARRNRGAELAERMNQLFGIELPSGPCRTTAGDLALLGIGPGAWLAMRERTADDLVSSLRAACTDVASVCDQSDAYAVLRLSGPKVRETLAKMVPLDLHACVFGCRAVAVTCAGHIGATLWRLEDAASYSAVFEIAVARSLAADFRHFLAASAAEFGAKCCVKRDDA